MSSSFTPAQVAAWLSTWVGPGQLTELRALHLPGKRAVSEYFMGDDLARMAYRALELEAQGAKGVYFVPNPLRLDLAGSRASARDADVLARRWLAIDVDPVRPADTSATDAEHAAAWSVVDVVRRALLAHDFPRPWIADSGNGWHLLLPMRMENNESSKTICKTFLQGLATRFNTAEAVVDTTTYNASRIIRLYGTLSRKGDPNSKERPHRRSCLHGPLKSPDDVLPELSAEQTEQALLKLLALWQRADEIGKGRPEGDRSAYTKKAIDEECKRVASAQAGDRNNQLNRSAYALGQLVSAGLADRGLVEKRLIEAGTQAGLDLGEIQQTLRSGLGAGQTQPRQVADRKPQQPKPVLITQESDVPVIDPADVCTIPDLIRAGSEVVWLWEGWIQRGVLTVLGAEGGTGKTRLCADLVRRIAHGLPWPDGQPMNLALDEKILWVLSDNHHDEMVSLTQAFGIVDSVLINATKDDPYGGTNLDTQEELAALEGRIKAVKPLFVVIDTVGNSTDKNLTRQEDAKAYYQPLQVIARRNQVAILCLTHLNATGGMLGRRVMEKVRVAWRLDKPDPGQVNRRRFEVTKSNSKYPEPLGITMGDSGNEYDTTPPSGPDEKAAGGKGARPTPRLDEMKEWLQTQLADGAKRVSFLRNMAETAGFGAYVLYKGKDSLGIEEFESEGKKWWKLTSKVAEF